MNRKIFGSVLLIIGITFTAVFARKKLTITDALKVVLSNNREFKVIEEKMLASRALADQAAVYRNPEISAEIEGVRADEIEIAFSQTFESGRKRRARVAVALAGTKALQVEYEQAIIALKAATIRQFCTILSINKKKETVDSLITTAERILNAISRRVEAGAAKRVDLLRAGMAISLLRIERDELERSVGKPLLMLYSLLSDTTLGDVEITGEMVNDIPLPTLEKCFEKISSHPLVQSYAEQSALKDAEVQQAEAEVLPDVAVVAGYVRNNERNEHNPLIGASLELPFFNKNRKLVAALKHEQSSVEITAHQKVLELKAQIEQIRLDIVQRDNKIAGLKDGLIPVAIEVYQELSVMYQNGSVGFIELTEAQSDLLNYQTTLIDLEFERVMFFVDLAERCGINVTIIK